MKIAVVYKSLTGNTKLVAEAIGNALMEEHDVCVCEPEACREADLYSSVPGLIKEIVPKK